MWPPSFLSPVLPFFEAALCPAFLRLFRPSSRVSFTLFSLNICLRRVGLSLTSGWLEFEAPGVPGASETKEEQADEERDEEEGGRAGGSG